MENGWGAIHPVLYEDPTTPGWKEGATHLKQTNPLEKPATSISDPYVEWSGRHP
jgi:hypothetical protein